LNKFLTAALICALSGCATLRPQPCPTAKAAMEKRGYEVIECWSDQEPDTYERVERCMVWTKDNQVKVKTVFARHCGL
jgi:hypothetical protein